MELRHYLKLIRRRWLILLIPAVVVFGLGLATYSPPQPGYNVGVRFIVGQTPTEAAVSEDEERYYNWLTSEYIVNGLTDWIRGLEFGELVSTHLAEQGISVPGGAISGGLVADNTRSMMTVILGHQDPELLAQMMDGVIAVLTEQNAQALPQLGGETAVLVQLDEPIVNANPVGLRNQLELPLRLLVGLIAGIALALLVEYLDPTIRDREEADALGLTILGEIPKQR